MFNIIMSTESKINTFIKQNDSIFSSLNARGIKFIRVDLSGIEDLEAKLAILLEENNNLKEVVKNNKPAPMIKEIKEVNKTNLTDTTKPTKPVQQISQLKTEKEKEKAQNEDEELEDEVSAPVLKFNTITNMEDIKRAFCNKEYETFDSLVIAHPFKFYCVNYKYSSDKNGCPDYAARNLIRGFVRNLDELRKYVFAGFRCVLTDPENKIYSYPSLWIVNSTDPLNVVFKDMSEDFDFNEVKQEDIPVFLTNFRKTNYDELTNVIDELYAH